MDEQTAADEPDSVEPEVPQAETSEDTQQDASEAEIEAPDEVAQLQAEVASLATKLLRARADYDNLVKRQQRDAALERERVKARVVEQFLPVFEYGQMAAVEAEKHPGALAEGVKMIVREFERMLSGEGVETIQAIDVDFDPARHEAIGEEAVEGIQAGKVSRIVKPGYLLGDRILRYAKVMVAPTEE